MSEHSIWTEIVAELSAELYQAHLDAAKSNAIPFGMEAVSTAQAVRRLDRMTPTERKTMLQTLGNTKMLDLARKAGYGNATENSRNASRRSHGASFTEAAKTRPTY